MKTRVIHTRFWQDQFINTLSHKEKLAFIYLITNERVSLSGIYELPDKFIKSDLDLTQRELDLIKERFSSAGKIVFYESWVKIVNHDKYNSYSGQSIEAAKTKEISKIPVELLGSNDTRVHPRGGTRVHPPSNQKSKIINNKLINNTNYLVKRSSKYVEENLLEFKGKHPSIDVEKEWQRCKDYYDSRGKKIVDWSAAFRNWLNSPYEKTKVKDDLARET